MSSVGGSAVECSLGGRLFTPKADSEVTIQLGGYSNEPSPNGNGTTSMIKNAMNASVNGLVVAIDHDKNDPKFLQDLCDGKDFKDFSLTLADGSTYQGKAQLNEMPVINTKNASAELKLFFDGKITRQ